MKREPRFDTPHAVVAPRAGLMRHFDPARVQGYCQSCENHGRVWSCPPFNNPPMDAFPAWTHAVIVCRQLWLAPDTTQSELLKHFLAARLKFGEWLRTLESRHARTTALIAGQCAACATCTRCEGKPCRAPKHLRYSLESVGFDVSTLTEILAGITLHWPKTGVPDYLVTVGALLCPDETTATMLCKAATSGDADTPSVAQLER